MSISTRLLLIIVCALAATLGTWCDPCDQGAAVRTINEDPNPLVFCAPVYERSLDVRTAAAVREE